MRVFETVGIPAAGHIMNFVVLSAALSSATCNLYFGGRLLFSLARGGYAPAALGRLNKRGMPTIAVFASSLGMFAAMMLAQQLQNTKAFEYMIGVAFFGGPFVWIMTLITHIGFRQKMGRAGQTFLRIPPGGSWSSTLGLVALASRFDFYVVGARLPRNAACWATMAGLYYRVLLSVPPRG